MPRRRQPMPRGTKPLARSAPARRTEMPRATVPAPRPAPNAAPRARTAAPTRKRAATGPTQTTRDLLASREGGGVCVIGIACAGQPRPLVPHHRLNRGMGGSKAPGINGTANLLEVCTACNGLMEDGACPDFYDNGWKVRGGQDPARVPVLFPDGVRYLLDAAGGRALAVA